MKTTALAFVLLLTAVPLPGMAQAPSTETGQESLPASLDLYLRARLAEASDRYREALDLYGRALEKDPDNAEIRIAFASLLGDLGMTARAVQLLDGRDDLDWYGRKILAMALARQTVHRPELLKEAERRLREVLGERADDPNVQISLGRVLMQEGRNAEAAEILSAVRRQRPGFPRLQLLNASALEAAGRIDEAAELYRKCASDPALGQQCRERLVSLLEKEGRSAEAATVLLDLSPPGDVAARLEAASLLLDAGEPRRALEAISDALAHDPESADALRLKARALVQLGRTREAEATIRRLLKHDPDDVGTRLTLVWVAMSRGDLAGARKELARTWRSVGEDGSSPSGIQVCLTGARLELLAQHPGAAREWLARIENPDGAGRELPVLLAETYRRGGDWREGVGALLRLQPRLHGEPREIAQALEAEMRLRTGDRNGIERLQWLVRRGSRTGAMAALQVAQTLEAWNDLLGLSDAVLRRFPNDRAALFARASALERTGRRGDAAKVFRKLLDEDPDDAAAANYLGYMWADAGEHLDEALELIQRAVAIEPDSGAYLDSLGWVYFRKGDLEQAEHWLRMAVEKGATDGTVLAHLGEVLLRRGKKDEGLELLRRALDLGCEHGDHVRKLVEEADGTPESE